MWQPPCKVIQLQLQFQLPSNATFDCNYENYLRVRLTKGWEVGAGGCQVLDCCNAHLLPCQPVPHMPHGWLGLQLAFLMCHFKLHCAVSRASKTCKVCKVRQTTDNTNTLRHTQTLSHTHTLRHTSCCYVVVVKL